MRKRTLRADSHSCFRHEVIFPIQYRHELPIHCVQSLRAKDNVLSAIPGATLTLRPARSTGDCGKKRVELSRGAPPDHQR